MFIMNYMIKLEMPIECRQIVVSFNRSFILFPSTHSVERFCRQNRLEIIDTESQLGNFIITVKRADSNI